MNNTDKHDKNSLLDDKLIDYVMGGLTPEEEKEIASYLSDNPEQAGAVRDLFEIMTDVALAQDSAVVAADAEERLLARIRTEATSPLIQTASTDADVSQDRLQEPPEIIRLDKEAKVSVQYTARTWWLGLGLAAALAVLMYLGFRSQVAPFDQQLAQLCDDTAVSCTLVGEDIKLGTVAQRADNSLFVVLDTPPPAGQVYQAWEISDAGPTSIGIWDGRAIDITQALDQSSVFGITIEPAGGSAQPTTTPIVVLPLS